MEYSIPARVLKTAMGLLNAIGAVGFVARAEFKGLVLIFMLVLGGPVASRAIASAAHSIGISLARSTRDDVDRAQNAAPFDP